MKFLIQVIDLAVLVGALYCAAILFTASVSLIVFLMLDNVTPNGLNITISGYMFILGIAAFYFAGIFAAEKFGYEIKKRNYIFCVVFLILINILIVVFFHVYDFDVLLIESSIEMVFPVFFGLVYAIFRRRVDFYGRRQG